MGKSKGVSTRVLIDQPLGVSPRFLHMLAGTCATGCASVFTIGGLQVACVEHCLGKGVSLESYLQALGKKSTGKASGTQDVPDDSICQRLAASRDNRTLTRAG